MSKYIEPKAKTRIQNLENALIEYVEHYGMTAAARTAFFGEDHRCLDRKKSAVDYEISNVIQFAEARAHIAGRH